MKKLLLTFVSAFLLMLLFTVPTFAGSEEYYTAGSISLITQNDIGVIRKGKAWASVVTKYNKNWICFSSNGKKVYIEVAATKNAQNLLNDDRASDAITSGLNARGSTKTFNYTRVYQKKPSNEKGITYTVLANYTVFAQNNGSQITVQCKLNDAVTILHRYQYYRQDIYHKEQKRDIFDYKSGIYGINVTTTIQVNAVSGKVYSFKAKNNKGKWVDFKAHGGSFLSYKTEGKGYLTPNYSAKDYVKIAIEVAKEAKSIAKNISTGNFIGLAQNGVSILGKMKKSSGVYKTNGNQALSNGLKMVYKTRITQPIQLVNQGDYFTTNIYTDSQHTGSAWAGAILNLFR